MARFFGLVLAFAATISSANAALLVSYNFGESLSKGPSMVAPNVAAAASDGQFGQSDTFGGTAVAAVNAGTTSQGRTESFYIAPSEANSFILLSSLSFDAKRTYNATTTTGTLRSVLASLGLNVGNPTVGDNGEIGLLADPIASGFQAATSVPAASYTVSPPLLTTSLTSNFQTFTVTFTNPLKIDTNKILRTNLTLTGAANGTTGVQTVYQLDNVNFYGTVVPEPSSMAVFGLLSVGAMVRRIRRK